MGIRDPKLRAYAKNTPSAHGGAFQTTRWGRSRKRPLSQTDSLHLTLRSSRARGAWSFRQPHHQEKIKALIARFAARFHIQVFSSANVGNHLHLHLKLGQQSTYKPFVRALTAAIAMAITGASRWKPGQGKFWDRRPFTRLVHGALAHFRLQDYVAVNSLEGEGIRRSTARWIVGWRARCRPIGPGF